MSVLPPSRFFPPAELAEPDGLLALGGRLSPEWLLDAYEHSIFPWPHSESDEPMLWWSPDPRAIFEYERFHIPRRTKRRCQQNPFAVTCDREFAGVIRGCATAKDRADGTWLTPRMIKAYVRLHQLGHAHSVEAWCGDQLAGGVYGVAIKGLFAAESMFYCVPEASKVALVHLVFHLRARGYRLIDIQQLTAHTKRFGALEISRSDYLARLADALKASTTFGDSLEWATCGDWEKSEPFA
jgi:leucyl/phenylalanyl-tRNA--protein transferase